MKKKKRHTIRRVGLWISVHPIGWPPFTCRKKAWRYEKQWVTGLIGYLRYFDDLLQCYTSLVSKCWTYIVLVQKHLTRETLQGAAILIPFFGNYTSISRQPKPYFSNNFNFPDPPNHQPKPPHKHTLSDTLVLSNFEHRLYHPWFPGSRRRLVTVLKSWGIPKSP